MRVSANTLAQLIAEEGAPQHGSVSPTGVLRLALDLRDARDHLAALEEANRLGLHPEALDRLHELEARERKLRELCDEWRDNGVIQIGLVLAILDAKGTE